MWWWPLVQNYLFKWCNKWMKKMFLYGCDSWWITTASMCGSSMYPNARCWETNARGTLLPITFMLCLWSSRSIWLAETEFCLDLLQQSSSDVLHVREVLMKNSFFIKSSYPDSVVTLHIQKRKISMSPLQLLIRKLYHCKWLSFYWQQSNPPPPSMF